MIAAQQDALNVVYAEDFGVPVIVVEGDLSGSGMSVGVDQVGAACHTGDRTCFDAGDLGAVVGERA